MKFKSTLILVVYFAFFNFLFLQAQNMEILGNRGIDLNNWDFPTVSEIYQDTNGHIYTYIDESSSPRNPELARFNIETNSWEDLSEHSFTIRGGSSSTSGTGLKDGSIITGTVSFAGVNGRNYHLMHRFYPDGTVDDLGNIDSLDGQFNIETIVMPNGEIYYAHFLFGASFRKLKKNSWVDYPSIRTGAVVRYVDLASDEENSIYAAYEVGLNNVEVKKFNGTSWEVIYEEKDTSTRPNLEIISSKEIYMSYYNNRLRAVSYTHLTLPTTSRV